MNLGQRNFFRTLVAGTLLGLALSGARADVFVANHSSGGHDIFRYDDSGHFLGKHRTGFQPLGMALGPDGGLYVHQYLGDHTSRFDPVTGQLSVFTSGGDPRPGPNIVQITFGGPGNDLYTADMSNPLGGVVTRFDGTTGAFEQRIAFGDAYAVGGVAVDAAGAIYASSRSGVIYKHVAGVTSTFATSSVGFEGLTLGPDGNLYAAARGPSGVLRYKPDGTPFGAGGSTTDPTFILDSHLSDAFSVTFGPDGNLYVANQHISPKVLRFAADGTFIDTFITSAHDLRGPSYIAFGSFAPAPVPELATWMLLALGLALVGWNARGRGRHHASETRAS